MATNKTLGASLLIAGCSIGAGMLALPVLSLNAGFLPALLMLFFACGYMILTGLLLTDVLFKTDPTVNLLGLSSLIFGRWMRFLIGGFYGFLFISLLTAYLSASGSLIQEWLGLQAPAASFLIAALFASILFLGMRGIDLANRLLFCGLVVAYAFLLLAAIPHIDASKWIHFHFFAAFLALPAMIISFGYHNLIPTLATYLEGNKKKLRHAIFIGNAISFTIYLLWQAALLGILNTGQENAFVTEILSNNVQKGGIVLATRLFSLFAITTSFITIAAGFVDFLQDGFHANQKNLFILLSCSIPLFFALSVPNVFYTALHYAGGVGTVFLFGFFPALSAWKIRENTKLAKIVLALSFLILLLTLCT